MKGWKNLLVLLVSVSLGIAALAQSTCTLIKYDMEYASQTAAEAAGWYFERPWRLVSSRDLRGEPQVVRNFPSGEKAAYFGWVKEDGTGTYQSDGIVSGVLTTPEIPLGRCEGCEYIVLSFKYYREVEYYTKGAYDKTWVGVCFSWGGCYEYYPDNPDKPIFYLDSRTPSESQWKTFTSEPVKVPEGAYAVRIGFWFDSVDGFANDYLGWLIDDIEITCTLAPVKIETPTLEQAVVGSDYWCLLWASGPEGVDYQWTVRGLPERLFLESNGGKEAWIRGIPYQSGTFQVTVSVKAGRGGPGLEDEKTFNLIVNAGWPYYIWGHSFNTGNCSCGTPAWTVPPGWQATGLWHVTNSVSGPTCGRCGGVAYYGQNECNNPNYNTGGRTRGYLTSPVIGIDATHSGRKLQVEFWSLRQVESYSPGGYDKAWVEVKIGSGDWVKIWERDSASPIDDCEWIRVTTDILIPQPTNGQVSIPFQIRFGFDSVDGFANNYLGWAIDNVVISSVPVPLRITLQCPLPEGNVGDEYRVELTAEGGEREKYWIATGLPSGLGVREEAGVWVITGTPREAGRYSVTLTVRDYQGNEDQKECLLIINDQKVLFKENFEDDGAWQEWETSGLWCRTANVYGVDLGPHGYVAYYGHPSQGNYNTGARTTGNLVSPAFDTLGMPYAKVTFDYWREVEYLTSGSYDRTYVEVRFRIGTTWNDWTTAWALDSSNASTRKWDSAQFIVAVPFGATKMQIRFVFDSVDKYYNNYVGWLVDNIKVVGTDTGTLSATVLLPKATPRDKITVFNVPNPVRDVHTTTFVVRGVQAEAIRVEIYDLTGRLVYRGEAPGNELVWHTEDLSGLPLANGVYLYKVYVKIDGSWIATETQKLVILR